MAAPRKTTKATRAANPQPQIISAADLIAKLKRTPPVVVEAPGLGWIKVQKLTVGEHDEIIDLATVRDDAGNPVLNERGMPTIDLDRRATLTIIAQVAEPELTPELLGSIDEMGVDAYSVLRAAISSAHGLTPEEAEARFPARR